MPRSLLFVALVLAAVLATPASAKKLKPAVCDPGTFAVRDAPKRLFPGVDSATPVPIVIDESGFITVPPGCPAVEAKRSGRKVSAKWGKATCTGLPKKVKLKAKFDASCDQLVGKLKSKKRKRRFVAERIPALRNFGAPSLSPVLEEGAALARVIGPDGGEALARGADGTAYRLRVPAGALAEPTGITLTPATAIGALPLEGGLLAAVNLEPSGLRFKTPATLTITPLQPLPNERLAGFGWSGDESAFGIAPAWISPDGASISIEVAHFSGIGAGIPGPSQLDAVAGELVTAELASASIEAQLIVCLAADATAACTAAELEQILLVWHSQIVAPRLTVGSNGPVEALTAHATLVRWRAEAEGHIAEHGSPDLEAALGVSLGQNLLNLVDVSARYRTPVCSGDVTDWRDWIRIPQELFLRARDVYDASQTIDLDPGFGSYCAVLALRDVDFPSTLQDQETELDLSLRAVVEVMGEGDVTVESEIDLHFGPGASGQPALLTEADGSLETTVSRDPTADRVSLQIVAGVADVNVLYASAIVVAGETDFVFEAHIDGQSPSYVPTGESREICVRSRVGAPAGTPVDFTIVEPGSLAATSAPLEVRPDGELRACNTYDAPDGPVGRNVAGIVTATMDFAGTTHEDVLEVFPHWLDVSLRADVGSGWQNATNTVVGIPGDGPYALEARVLQAGESLEDPPVAWEDAFDELIDVLFTLPSGQACCGTGTTGVPDSEGRFAFTWQANGSASNEFHVEVLAGEPGESFAGASVTLARAPWSLAASFPSVVAVGIDEDLRLSVTDDEGDPVPSAWVEIDATGGSVLASAGTTNALGVLETPATLGSGESTLVLEIRVAAFPGGPTLVSETVTASGGCGFPIDEQPTGTYEDSCESCFLESLFLSCNCLDLDGMPRSSDLNITQCRADEDIANIDGELACVLCPGVSQ